KNIVLLSLRFRAKNIVLLSLRFRAKNIVLLSLRFRAKNICWPKAFSDFGCNYAEVLILSIEQLI
ncbi:hypothetical protein, partial [Lysinibacillus agricola]|uniref:hypothetical protein n=1 Tax=Lysinibacillus agricola TaxID=2590012 RepID=UPI003C2E5B9D